MFSQKLFLLLALMTPALHGSMRMLYATAPAQSHVQSVLQMAHQTAHSAPNFAQSYVQAARDTHAVYQGSTPSSHASRPFTSPTCVPSVYDPLPFRPRTVPAFNPYPLIRPTLVVERPATVVHHTTYVPRPLIPQPQTTAKEDEGSWVPSKKTILIAAATITGACILVYIVTRKDKPTTTEVVLVPTPALTTAAGQAPILSDWDNAYNRLSLKEKNTINELHLEHRGDYYARLKGTALEQQEIKNLLQSNKSGADIIYTAQVQFLNYFYAYEKQLNDATLAQHVIRSSDRLMILYNYFNKQ